MPLPTALMFTSRACSLALQLARSPALQFLSRSAALRSSHLRHRPLLLLSVLTLLTSLVFVLREKLHRSFAELRIVIVHSYHLYYTILSIVYLAIECNMYALQYIKSIASREWTSRQRPQYCRYMYAASSNSRGKIF